MHISQNGSYILETRTSYLGKVNCFKPNLKFKKYTKVSLEFDISCSKYELELDETFQELSLKFPIVKWYPQRAGKFECNQYIFIIVFLLPEVSFSLWWLAG